MKNNDFASAKSTSFEQIPVVDISEIHTKDGFEKTAIELVHIARSIGFFYIKGHGISPELISQAFNASKRFFELPLDAKSSIEVDVNQRGWMGQGMAQLEGAKHMMQKKYFFGDGMLMLMIKMLFQEYLWSSQTNGLIMLRHS